MLFDKERLVALYLDGFPVDGEAFARYFVNENIENAVVLTENDRYVSAGYLVVKRAKLFGKEISLPYFSALSTRKELRGQGKIASVISGLLKKAVNVGAPLVALSPFSPSYYKRYGFVDASYCGKTTIVGGNEYSCRVCKQNDFKKLFSDFTARYDFKLLYGEDEFNALNKELVLYGKIAAFYDTDDNVVAFAAFDDRIVFKYAAVVDVLKIEGLKGKQLRDFSKSDKVFSQIRLASADDFFRLVKYVDCDFEYSIRLIDDSIPENNGVYIIEKLDGDVSIKRLPMQTRIATIINMNASELVQAFIGGKYPFVKPSVHFQDEY